MTTKRRLHNREDNEDLREAFEFRLLVGLNGKTAAQIPLSGKGEPQAFLPHSEQSIQRVSLFLKALKLALDDAPLGLTAEALGLPRKEEWLKTVNQDLKRYRQYPQIVPDLSSGELTTEMAFFDGDAWENGAITDILWLFKQGQLFRISTCSTCKKWFYAMRNDQRFCDTKCRQKEHGQSPESRERRKNYMREYRRSGNEDRAKSRASTRGNRKRSK